ncbi:STAS domain-containing protein [Cryptosporidium andersoni]|uniref:STAS domain-containing protein n=1 Tax=Cryptosporidium andersoni TaxID=117008 RepID=A0A1J4MJR0_9CRYT|nr:STAS domain-containing protein [Cryptosporidium andersoni]
MDNFKEDTLNIDLNKKVILSEYDEFLTLYKQRSEVLNNDYKLHNKFRRESENNWRKFLNYIIQSIHNFFLNESFTGIRYLKYIKWSFNLIICDIFCGLAEAALAIPQGLSYASLINVYPYMGLYSGIIQPPLYLLIGSSIFVSIGVNSVEAILASSAIDNLINSNTLTSTRSSVLSLIIFFHGISCCILRLFGISVFVDLLSDPILQGFLSGVALSVIIKEIPLMLALKIDNTNNIPLYSIILVFKYINTTRWQAILFSICTIIFLELIIWIKIYFKSDIPIPSQLLIVIITNLISAFTKPQIPVIGFISENNTLIPNILWNEPQIYNLRSSYNLPFFIQAWIASLPMTFISFLSHYSIAKSAEKTYLKRDMNNLTCNNDVSTLELTLSTSINESNNISFNSLSPRIQSLSECLSKSLGDTEPVEISSITNRESINNEINIQLTSNKDELNDRKYTREDSDNTNFKIDTNIQYSSNTSQNINLSPDSLFLARTEILALGIINIIGSFFHCLPGAASLARTNQNCIFKIKSPLHNLSYCTGVLLVTLLLLKYIRYLPEAVLGAIITHAMCRIIDFSYVLNLYKVRSIDTIFWIVAFIGTISAGIIYGLVFPLFLSTIYLIRFLYRPKIDILGRLPGTLLFKSINKFPQALEFPYIKIIRFEGPLSYININHFITQIQNIIQNWLNNNEKANFKIKSYDTFKTTDFQYDNLSSFSNLNYNSEDRIKKKILNKIVDRIVIIDACMISDIDYTAIESLRDLQYKLSKYKVKIWFASFGHKNSKFLLRSGFYDIIPLVNCFVDLSEAIAAAQSYIYGEFCLSH